MEKRVLNISFYKSGNGGISSRLSIPIKWIKDMELIQDDKSVEVYYDEVTKTITIQKKK